MRIVISKKIEYTNIENPNDVMVNRIKISKPGKENLIYNENYINVANTFNEELYKYFENSSCTENAITQCTQSMWYRLYLEKKRLDKLGLCKIYDRTHPIKYMKDEYGRDLVSLIYKYDGKNTFCKVIDSSNSNEKFFYKNGKNKKLKTFFGKKIREYMITSSKFKTLDECTCPNCGAYMKVEQLIDGCDYCHTKYKLEDLKGKIISLYEKNNNTKSKRGAPLILIAMSAVCFVIPIFIPLGIIIMIIAMLYVKNNGEKTTRSLGKLKSRFNLLSEETLLSEIEQKLFALHYCDDQKDIQALCDCKLNANYNNILLCDTEKYFIENVTITPDDKFVLMDCRFHSLITYLQGNTTIKTTKEIVKFKLKRSAESLSEIKPDFLNYKCENCGSSLSLLNGGRCEYCGSQICLENFDWKVVEYESNWESKKI